MTLLYESVSGGELFLYAASLLAPIVFIALDEPRNKRFAFPTRLGHLALTLLGLMVCAMIFALQRMGFDFNPMRILWLSVGFFISSFILLYFAILYRDMSLPKPKGLKKDEQNLVDAVARSR